jgi:hypothetical protein
VKIANPFLPFLIAIVSITGSIFAAETVTVDNFVRAETDMTMKRYAALGAFGKLFHLRAPTPIDQQGVIRMNRDTLYSAIILDLAEPATIIKPATNGRFQSMLVINQDHSMLPVEHGAGEFVLTQEKVGTRYAFVAFRTFIDANNPKDIEAANALQDMIQVKQSSVGSFQVPDWDEVSLKKIRDAINVLAASHKGMSDMFGDKKTLNPIHHLMGAAYGWGGNPRDAAMYDSVTPEKRDGKTPYFLHVKDVPVNGFWSVTVYNQDGFMQKNDLNIYSYNNVTAKKDEDGGITIHFGGDPNSTNYVPIIPGWNYTVRMYQPKQELLDGSWTFPKPVEAK